VGGVFNADLLTKMGQWNKKPMIFPLSNPSDNAECTFEDAMKYTEGRCLFASGSPFPSLEMNGRTHHAGQGNNMYVFPGIGLGAILSKAVNISQNMIYASAEALSTSLTQEEKDADLLYPDLMRIREVSVIVTRGVIRAAQADKLDRERTIIDMTDDQLDDYIRARMYDPKLEKTLIEGEYASIRSGSEPTSSVTSKSNL